jgi:hypothetical protein
MTASIPRSAGRLVLSCVVMATPLMGCSTIHRIPMDPGIPETETRAARESGQRIEGYTTADGVTHKFDGWVVLAGPDSLSFRRAPHRSAIWFPPPTQDSATDTLQRAFVLPRAAVASVEARQGSPGKTTLLVVSILGGCFAAIALAFAIGGGIGPMGFGQ